MTDFKRNNNKRKDANRRTAIHKEIVAIRKVYYSSHRIVSNDSASSETSDDDTLNVSVDLVGHRKIPDFDSTKLFIFVSATQIYVEGVKYNNVREFNIFESKYNHKELSSENIWECIYNSVNHVVERDDIVFEKIKFFAINAMVVIRNDGTPVSVSKTGEKQRNVILWMDKRGANEYNNLKNLSEDTRKVVEKYIHVPKLVKILWIKKNLPSTWKHIGDLRFLNLQEFIFFKCFGHMRWRTDTLIDTVKIQDILTELGHDDLCSYPEDLYNNHQFKFDEFIETAENTFPSLYKDISPKFFIGWENELSNMRVIINPYDYYVSQFVNPLDLSPRHYAYILKYIRREVLTNPELMLPSPETPIHLKDFVVITNGFEMNSEYLPMGYHIISEIELNSYLSGNNGSLFDFIIQSYLKHSKKQKSEGLLNEFMIEKYLANLSNSHIHRLASLDINVLPDLQRNRYNFCESLGLGMCFGINSIPINECHEAIYLAMLQSLAFTYRLVIERISNKQNTIIRDIIYSGHYVRNEIFLQMLADVTKCTVGVDVPQKDQFFNNLDSKFIKKMSSQKLFSPSTQRIHEGKYNVFLKMMELRMMCNSLMND